MTKRSMLVVGLLLAMTACTPPETTQRSATTTASAAERPSRWRQIAEPPLSVAPSVPVWTGREIIIWGGGNAKGQTLATGAAYDPRLDRWSDLPAAPLTPRSGHSTIWTGREVVIWGGEDLRDPRASGPATGGAAFDPITRAWRRIPDAPIGGRSGHVAVWTGTEMFVWGGYEQCCPVDSTIHQPQAAAYDPAQNRWRRLPDVPSPASGGGGPAITTVARGHVFVFRGGVITDFDPGPDKWTSFGDPIPPAAPTCMSTNGPSAIGAELDGQLFVWTGGCDPTRGLSHTTRAEQGGGWRATADSPLQSTAAWALAAGDRGVFLGSASPAGTDVYRYDVTASRMEKLDHPGVDIAPGASAIWTGTDLIVLDGTRGIDQPRPGAAYGPPR